MTTGIKQLLKSIHLKYGYDFSQYAEAHVVRRISNRLALSSLESVNELKEKVLHDDAFASILLRDLSINVTEMFRDPDFYRALREKVVPILKTYPFIKIWHAGCSTGEEVYSMAILLKEEGLYDRSTIYATDFNQIILNQAKEGIFPTKIIKEYTANYHKAGGIASFSNYYASHYDMVIMQQSLKKNIVWANHNLVTDSVFSEVNMILCRNVLIYFQTELQNKVHKLFLDSLANGGILCLGRKESLRFNNLYNQYTRLDEQQRVFKKKYSVD